MKLAFTTLGCPNWDMDTIISRAVEYGYQGVDFRGYRNEMNIYQLPEFSDNAEQTRKRFRDAGLEITCFSSSVHAFSAEKFQQNMEEIKAYTKLCEIFETPYIRVFGGKIGDTPREEAVEQLAANLNEFAKIVANRGVKLLVETHDDWIAARDLRRVMEKVDSQTIGVLWDTHHPYRMLGETPEESWRELGAWIEYTHFKDSVKKSPDSDEFTYCLTGEGEIPLIDIHNTLKSNGYTGYYTFEWEKKWHPEILEPEVAFPQFVEFMRKIEAS